MTTAIFIIATVMLVAMPFLLADALRSIRAVRKLQKGNSDGD